MSEGPRNSTEELLRGIGPRLKAAREAKDLTLQEVSSRTRINIQFLDQIEKARSENLPGLTFVRGFIRNYLEVLELQDEEIEAHLKQISELEQYKLETELGPRINEMHGDDDAAGLPLRKNLILAVVLIAVVAVGYLGVRVIFSRDDAPTGTAKVSQPATQQSAESPPARQGQPPEPPAAAAAQPPAGGTMNVKKSALPVSSPRNLRLTVRGLEPTWIRLSVDRAPPVEVHISPAETMNWEANEEFRLIIGKSQGVAVYLNGEDILLPEGRDQLIPNIVLNKLTLLRLEN